MLKPLDKRFWPQQHSARILNGETEVRALAKTLGEPAREAVEEFRDFKLQNRAPGKTLVKLQTASLTYLPSSAECNRGDFLPLILLTASIATSCVNKASPRFSSWI